MFWIFGLPFLAGIGIALYEWRAGRKMRHDPPPYDARLSERGAYTKAEQIRAEGVALQNPTSGPF